MGVFENIVPLDLLVGDIWLSFSFDYVGLPFGNIRHILPFSANPRSILFQGLAFARRGRYLRSSQSHLASPCGAAAARLLKTTADSAEHPWMLATVKGCYVDPSWMHESNYVHACSACEESVPKSRYARDQRSNVYECITYTIPHILSNFHIPSLLKPSGFYVACS